MSSYYGQIVAMLGGNIPNRPDVEAGRADMEGVDAVIALYQRAGGEDRTAIIEALGRVIERAGQHPAVSALALSLVNALDLAQLEPNVRRLAEKRIVQRREDLSQQVHNFFAFRQLHAAGETNHHEPVTVPFVHM